MKSNYAKLTFSRQKKVRVPENIKTNGEFERWYQEEHKKFKQEIVKQIQRKQ